MPTEATGNWNELVLDTPQDLDIANEYRVNPRTTPEFIFGETVLHNHIKGVYKHIEPKDGE